MTEPDDWAVAICDHAEVGCARVTKRHESATLFLPRRKQVWYTSMLIGIPLLFGKFL